MTNAPALVVRHRRFTLVIAVLLAFLLSVAALGVSVELHAAGAGIGPILAPMVLVLLAGYLTKSACDRWAASNVCLTVSAEGLTLPGIAVRPIPWTAVKSARGVCCSPLPDPALTPRHYMLFEVEAPDSFAAGRRHGLRALTAPLPRDAPPITLDITELDTGKEAILAAVHRFHPAAVADADTRWASAASGACVNDASIGLGAVQDLWPSAAGVRSQIAAVRARSSMLGPAAFEAWRMAGRWMHQAAAEWRWAGTVLAREAGIAARHRALELRERSVAAADAARRSLMDMRDRLRAALMAKP